MPELEAFWSCGDDWYHACSNCKHTVHFYWLDKKQFIPVCPKCNSTMKWKSETQKLVDYYTNRDSVSE